MRVFFSWSFNMVCGFQSLINKYFKKTSSQKIWFTELYAMVKGNTETKQLYICKINSNFEVVARSFEIHDKDKILGHQSVQCSLAPGQLLECQRLIELQQREKSDPNNLIYASSLHISTSQYFPNTYIGMLRNYKKKIYVFKYVSPRPLASLDFATQPLFCAWTTKI